MRRPGRHRSGLSSEPGRGSRENVALLTQLFVLTPQPDQFVAFIRRDTFILFFPVAVSPVRDDHPVTDRLRGRFELSGEVIGIAASTDKVNDLAAEFRG